MQFRLRTLLIVLAVGPVVLAGAWWGWLEWQALRAAQQQERVVKYLFLGRDEALQSPMTFQGESDENRSPAPNP